jgi:outer membrane scaffolding protein for murein synthesis (MipA/OmpV family)
MRAAFLCGGFALAVLAAPARAEVEPGSTGAALESTASGPLWELGLGAAALRLPDYRGSDQSRGYLLPLPYVVYRGTILRADRDGARALLLDAERIKVDVSVAASVPTHSRDNIARSGMADLAPSVELGPNVNLALLRSADGRVRLDLRLPLRAAVAVQRSPRGIGTTFSPNLNLDVDRVGGGWHVGLLAGPLFADRKYHAYYYGVEPADATPQRHAYRARGGYAGWQALAATSRRIGRAWVGAFLRYDSLRGAVFASSPLLRRDHGVTAGIGISWVFAASDRLVPAQD